MSTLKLITPGTIATPRLGKATPFDFIVDPDGGSPLYAAYGHGTAFHAGAVSAGVPRTDLSGNGRTLTQTGSDGTNIGQAALGFLGTGGVYMNTPFNADALAAAGIANEMTVLHFAKNPGANGSLFIQTVSGSGARFEVQSNATYDSQTIMRFDGNALVAGLVGNPISAFRTDDFYMFGASFSLPGAAVTGYRGYRGAVTSASTAFSTVTYPSIAGAFPIRIGSRSVNTPNTTVSLGSLFFDRVLTPAEVATVYAGARPVFLARSGVDV